LEESPLLTQSELGEIEYNELTVALRGHESDLELVEQSQRRTIKSWSLEICQRMSPICEALDALSEDGEYSMALNKQIHAIQFPESLPAAKILNELLTTQQPFQTYAMNLSKNYAAQFRDSPARDDFSQDFSRLAEVSRSDQEKLENAEGGSLKEYIEKYLAN
jgi:glutamate--cysteine ligase